jgi:exodeoxyribonuclease V alpha subunit
VILKGILKKIRFSGQDFWTVAVLNDGKEDCVIVGSLPTGQAGAQLTLHGDWVVDRRYGRQFKFNKYEIKEDPMLGIKGFLEQIAFIGPTRAAAIVKAFGDKTISVIEQHPKKLTQIPGITESMIDRIHNEYVDYSARKETFIALKGKGLTNWQIGRVIDAYGRDAVDRFNENPYQMVYDIKGFGFLTVDRIARGAGMKGDDPNRIKAGLLHTLQVCQERGHMYLTEEELYKSAFDILKINRKFLSGLAVELVKKGYMIKRGNRIYFSQMFNCEYRIAKALMTRSGLEVSEPPEEAYIDGPEETPEKEPEDSSPAAAEPTIRQRSQDESLDELKKWAGGGK